MSELSDTVKTLQVHIGSHPGIFGESLERHRAFWMLDDGASAVGLNMGLFMDERCPRRLGAA